VNCASTKYFWPTLPMVKTQVFVVVVDKAPTASVECLPVNPGSWMPPYEIQDHVADELLTCPVALSVLVILKLLASP